MIVEKLIEKFGDIINYMSCVYIADGENVLRYFLDKIKPKNIIEIGTYQGVSSAILSEYAKKIETFDVVDLPLRAKIWNFLKIKNVKFNLIKNNEDKKKKIQKLFNTETFDFCFIDGDHFEKGVQVDFEIVKKCRQILIHDYEPAFPEVFDFCNNIKGYEKESKGLFCLLTKQKEKLPEVDLKDLSTVPVW